MSHLLFALWIRTRLVLHRLRLVMTDAAHRHLALFPENPRTCSFDMLIDYLPRLIDHTDIKVTSLQHYKEESNPARHEFVLAHVSYKLAGKDARGAVIFERGIQPPAVHERSMSDSDLRTIPSRSSQSLRSSSHSSSVSSSIPVPAFDRAILAARAESLLLGREVGPPFRIFNVDGDHESATDSFMKLVAMARLVSHEFPDYQLYKRQCYFYGVVLYELFTRVVRDTTKEFSPNLQSKVMGRVVLLGFRIGQPSESAIRRLVELFQRTAWPNVEQMVVEQKASLLAGARILTAEEHAQELAGERARAEEELAGERARAEEDLAKERARAEERRAQDLANERARAEERRAQDVANERARADERIRAAEEEMAQEMAQMKEDLAQMSARMARSW
ncbi:hypothetical protein PLICRDRAFT_180866 [Plicaturopsis crispa FD-325 SS-3]|uniref:Uncharacterized protein n=1 Tax=Plicaturopsis crispa FD-325 SS-3 TaxID=944288 RepID=A0A0C9SVB3_PLICR|nr:hypothetical protein PLICRDRAFT_180866 [Plicaturopsis crispa FD-325 SS-3]